MIKPLMIFVLLTLSSAVFAENEKVKDFPWLVQIYNVDSDCLGIKVGRNKFITTATCTESFNENTVINFFKSKSPQIMEPIFPNGSVVTHPYYKDEVVGWKHNLAVVTLELLGKHPESAAIDGHKCDRFYKADVLTNIPILPMGGSAQWSGVCHEDHYQVNTYIEPKEGTPLMISSDKESVYGLMGDQMTVHDNGSKTITIVSFSENMEWITQQLKDIDDVDPIGAEFEVGQFIDQLTRHVTRVGIETTEYCKTESCRKFRQGKMLGLCIAYSAAYRSFHQLSENPVTMSASQFSINLCEQFIKMSLSFNRDDTE